MASVLRRLVGTSLLVRQSVSCHVHASRPTVLRCDPLLPGLTVTATGRQPSPLGVRAMSNSTSKDDLVFRQITGSPASSSDEEKVCTMRTGPAITSSSYSADYAKVTEVTEVRRLRREGELCVNVTGGLSEVMRPSGEGCRGGSPSFNHELFDQRTCTYTYLLADRNTNEAILIDPVKELVNRDLRVIKDLGLNLIYGVNTHVHADHVTGTGELKKKSAGCRSVIAAVSGAKADMRISEGDSITFGKFTLECRSTPGHTSGCMSYVLHEKEMAFTGDALLIRGCGRTDFQEGSSSVLYDSVHSKILSLPPQFRLYPAHDYTGQMMTTVEEEKKHNPRLSRPKEEFVRIMQNLNLPYPRFIDEALPANMVCGIYDTPEDDSKS